MPKNKKLTKSRRKAEFVYKLRYFIKTLPYHILVMGNVFLVAFLFDKYIEAGCFLISFFSLRYKFETTYHSDSMFWCMVFTNLIFALSIILCPSVYMYIFGSVIFAYIDCLILWFIQDRKEQKQMNKKLNLMLDEVRKQLDDYVEKTKLDPKAELLRKCELAELSDRDTKLAIMYYYERKTPKDIWLWYCQQKEYEQVEWATIYQTLWRIGKKIKNVEDL